MNLWTGKLLGEGLETLELFPSTAETYVRTHQRCPLPLASNPPHTADAPKGPLWVPLIAQHPAEGIALALAAIKAQIPFLFLEAEETPENFDGAIADAFERHRSNALSIGLFSRSSGSSGRVKLIPRTLKSWVDSFEAHREAFNLDHTHVWLIPGHTGFSATVYHALLGLHLGKRVVLQGSLSPQVTLKLIQDADVDTLLTVPTRLGIILKAAARNACETSPKIQSEEPYSPPPHLSHFSPLSILACDPLKSLNHVITVGEVLAPKVLELAEKLLPQAQLWHYYGAAELGQVAYCSYQALAQAPRLLGHPFKDVAVSVDDQSNIVVSSPYLALDYPAPATVYDKGEWRVDQLFFKGRVDLQFNRHGRKYNLEPLSLKLSQHPLLTNFWIERIPDPHQSQALEAYALHLLIEVATTEDACERYERPATADAIKATVAEIQQWCKSAFSPRTIYVYHHAAHTSGGKIAWHRMTPTTY